MTMRASDRRPTRRTVVALVLATLVAAVAALAIGPVMTAVLALREGVTGQTTPLDTIRRAPGLVLAAVPAVVLAAIWLCLAPGVFLAAAWGRCVTLGHWLGAALAIALVVVSAAVEAAEAAAGGPLTRSAFIGLVTALAMLCGAVAWRAADDATPGRDSPGRIRGSALWPLVATVYLLVVALFPKFFFEAFNGDGAHTYDATRLLLFRAVAFFGETAGGISGFPGMNSVLFTYPGAWFMRLFGETEASVRLPVLLYLVVLGPVILSAASIGGRSPRARDGWLVMGSLVVFTVVQAFSATYDPYCADIALPATQDTLFLALFTSLLIATLEARPLAIYGLTILCVLCSQAAVAMTVFWFASRWLADREARHLIPRQAAIFVAGVVSVSVLGALLGALGVPAPGGEHGLLALLRKFVTLQITDVRRVLFVFVPVGLYPALALTRLSRREPLADALALLLAASFGLYYVMAYYSLHYFVPAMIVALLLYWRTELTRVETSGATLPALAGVAVAVALYLSWPVERGFYTATRDLGRRIDVSAIAGYDQAQNTAWAHLDDLSQLFPKDMEPAVPGEVYGGSPLAFHIYAEQAGGDDAAKPYAFTPDADGQWRPVVRDQAAFARDRVLTPTGSRGSSLYDIPRDLLFQRGVEHAGFLVLDFRPLAKRLIAKYNLPITY